MTPSKKIYSKALYAVGAIVVLWLATVGSTMA
jgi:hypothetical protein